ncbi:hypothetical protein OG21DRAFT_155661 [Imleria badia]|nr:hypothetical protein OG21DRAFT_155661 [Imleria badia]
MEEDTRVQAPHSRSPSATEGGTGSQSSLPAQGSLPSGRYQQVPNTDMKSPRKRVEETEPSGERGGYSSSGDLAKQQRRASPQHPSEIAKEESRRGSGGHYTPGRGSRSEETEGGSREY